jgi:cytidylate kinase
MSDTTRPFVIALDGPAASGKSVVGLAVAERLGFFYVDTGVLYRALTWAAQERGVDTHDASALHDLVRTVTLEVLPPSRPGRQVDVLVDGQDVTPCLREPRVDAQVSFVAADEGVRAALVPVQRAMIRPPGTIMAGRDIGTVIVPDADLKLWLTASLAERARRRAAQSGADYQDVLDGMRERDQIDSSRAAAPMVRAPDAVEVDTDTMSIEQAVHALLALAADRQTMRTA